MTNTLPPDVVRQDLAHIANEWAITGPTTSSCSVPVKIWTIIVGSPKHKSVAPFFSILQGFFHKVEVLLTSCTRSTYFYNNFSAFAPSHNVY